MPLGHGQACSGQSQPGECPIEEIPTDIDDSSIDEDEILSPEVGEPLVRKRILRPKPTNKIGQHRPTVKFKFVVPLSKINQHFKINIIKIKLAVGNKFVYFNHKHAIHDSIHTFA